MYDVKNLLNSPFELILADGKKVLLPAMGELKNLDIHPMSLDMVKVCGFLEVTPSQQATEPADELDDELDDGLGDLEEDEPVAEPEAEPEVESEADKSADELDDGLGDELDDGLGDLEEDEPEPPKAKKTSTRKGKK